MHGSYFHHLFLLCLWLLVKAPQLACDAVSISGQQDRAAANQCWQKCSPAANVSRSTAKAFESPETCFKECLKKGRSHQFAGNEKVRALWRRIKRDLNVSTNSTPISVEQEDKCLESLKGKSLLPQTHVKLSLVARGPKFYYANISWNISSDVTRNWTQGYLVLYALQIPGRKYASRHCHRVLGMNTSFSGFNITNENLTDYSVLYYMVMSLSQERGNSELPEEPWGSITFQEATRPSIVRTEDKCLESLKSKSLLPQTHVKLSLVARGPKFYYANISWNISSDVTRNWTQGYLVLYALQIPGRKYASLHCHRVLGMNTSFSGFNITNENLTDYSVLYYMVMSLSQERGNSELPKDPWGSITFQEATRPSIVRTDTITQDLSTSSSNTITQDLSTSSSNLPTSAIVAMCVTVAFVAVAVVIWWRFVDKKTKEEDVALLDSGFKFDAFIIYSTTDEKWVKKKLLSTLEKNHNIKCCIHYRDFLPGVPFVENMAQSVYNSRKTIAVVSKSFLSSNYCNHELNIALHRLVERGDDSVIVIKLDDVEDSELPIELQVRSYIDFTKATDKKTWEYKLVNSFIGERG